MEKQKIEIMKNGPYMVHNVENFSNSQNDSIESKDRMALCRCGHSNSKPFCDGTHGKIGFDDKKLPDQVPQDRNDFKGDEITISDNPGVCSHAGHCDGNLPKVFWSEKDGKRIPNPDEALPDELIKTIKKCPSGALAYKMKDVLYDKQDRDPGIHISKDGPLQITGNIEFDDSNKPDSKEHYTLCRCGSSKNKPFCDGSHWKAKFTDDKN